MIPPQQQMATLQVGLVQSQTNPAVVSAEADPPLSTRTGPPLSQALGFICCPNPLFWAGSCTTVQQNSAGAVMYWGRYEGTISEPGIYCLNPCGRETRWVSMRCNTLELNDIKTVDAKGSPLVLSGVVTYVLTSAKKACVDVDDPTNFIRLQAMAALKQVTGQYPYAAPAGQHSLQSDIAAISAQLVAALQEKTTITGASIMNFEIVDLAYAPEIASVMLVRQQAEALVDARRLIVGAAVDMSQTAVAQLEANGATLSDSAKERITSTLLAVVCSHNGATTTIPLRGQ